MALKGQQEVASLARYRINTPKVIAETIDGEAVLVNLDTGDYFSLDEVGSRIWDSLVAGATAGEIAEALSDRYEAGPGALAEAVSGLMDELEREDLIAVAGERGVEPLPEVAPAVGPPRERLPFEEPVLRKYTDMQDLLMLDPIHEVDESGWPNRA